MKKRENFPPKQLGDICRGGSYPGGRVWGKFGGELLGEMQKKGWKNFFGGVLGSCEPQQILGARKFGGHF